MLGIVQPGDTLPVPYGWQRAGLPSTPVLSCQGCSCLFCMTGTFVMATFEDSVLLTLPCSVEH